MSAVSGRVGTARRLIWPSFMGESPQAGLGAPSRVASRLSGASSGNVFQSPDVTGHSPVFFKVRQESGITPSLLIQIRKGFARKNFYDLSNFFNFRRIATLRQCRVIGGNLNRLAA